jgi:membrane-bound serine protease (ClpP class)
MTYIVVWTLAGIFLLLAEIVLPGMIAGLAGVICMIIAAVLSFREFGPTGGSLVVTGQLLFGLFCTVLYIRYFPSSRIGRWLSLRSEVPPQVSAPASWETLVGLEGETLTPLRPSGYAKIGDRKYDVVAEGLPVESGRTVRVVKVEGPRIVVRPV